jgi:hypothetical protein
MFTGTYNWVPLSQFSPMHTSTTILIMNIVMTADLWVGIDIKTTYRWVLRFVVETCFAQ